MASQHSYREELQGRSFRSDPKTGARVARITCSQCKENSNTTYTRLPPPEVIDKKFLQRGWELDPAVCPQCQSKARAAKAEAKAEAKTAKIETNTQNTTHVQEQTKMQNNDFANSAALKQVSMDVHKATAKMHQLLVLHFDPDNGSYAEGWNDERIAKESSLAVAHVADVRSIAYGDIKEPEEITALRRDIKALNELITETLVAAQKEVNALNNRVAEITKKLGIK